MKFLTNQQIFDRVSKHLLKQNEKSTDIEDGVCAYRGPRALRCAIGCLIPDSNYTEEIEGEIMNDSLNDDPVFMDDKEFLLLEVLRSSGIPIYQETTLVLLKALQDVHDDCDPEVWPAILSALRLEHDLSI